MNADDPLVVMGLFEKVKSLIAWPEVMLPQSAAGRRAVINSSDAGTYSVVDAVAFRELSKRRVGAWSKSSEACHSERREESPARVTLLILQRWSRAGGRSGATRDYYRLIVGKIEYG